jgi:hypothetical protein
LTVGFFVERLTSGRGARATVLLDGSSSDSAFGNEQVAGVLVYIFALATAAIAACAAHRVIDRGESSVIREVDVGALA